MAEKLPAVQPSTARHGVATCGNVGEAGVPQDAAPVGASLGIYAEKYSPSGTARVSGDLDIFGGKVSSKGNAAQKEGLGRPSNVSEDGEILDIPRDSRTARAERYELKAAAGRLLPKNHRTTKCMRWRLPNQEIQVLKGVKTERAFYHGLQVCSMPWTCPVCASKISERRRHEVRHAMNQATALGLKVNLLTLTVPHGLGDDVSEIVDKMTKAWTRLWQGKAGMQLREALGLVGHIRALEVTYGDNGFHPHFHALLFYHPNHSTGAGWASLPARWQQVAVRSGLPAPSLDRGCRVDDGDHAASYVAKGVWGLESEVTKGNTKTGKKGSRTPLDLLKGFMNGDTKAGALWRVYVDAFTGRRQLHWSVGLKKLLSVVDFSDEEIANKPDDEPAILLVRISDYQWKAIRRQNLQSTILDLAETSTDDLRLFLSSLDSTKPDG